MLRPTAGRGERIRLAGVEQHGIFPMKERNPMLAERVHDPGLAGAVNRQGIVLQFKRDIVRFTRAALGFENDLHSAPIPYDAQGGLP